MTRQRQCRAEIVTAGGDRICVAYKSFYPVGSRGNYLDMVWRAHVIYDLPFEEDRIDSIILKYDYGDDV